MTNKKTETKANKTFELNLPVFKQGDDMAHCLSQARTVKKAFEMQAENYEEAARICRKMAGIASEERKLKVDADTHIISLFGPTERLLALEKEGVVRSYEWDEDDDSNEE